MMVVPAIRRRAIDKKEKVVRVDKPKNSVIPSGFVLLVDTREQQPLFSKPPTNLIIERVALKDGDYSIKGHEDKIVIERKKVNDLCSYIGKERRRTNRKIIQLESMDWAALIIEANEKDLETQYKYGKVTPAHIRGFLLSLSVKHGIHVYICKRRERLEKYILNHFLYYWGMTHGK